MDTEARYEAIVKGLAMDLEAAGAASLTGEEAEFIIRYHSDCPSESDEFCKALKRDDAEGMLLAAKNHALRCARWDISRERLAIKQSQRNADLRHPTLTDVITDIARLQAEWLAGEPEFGAPMLRRKGAL